nr:unnamed protein product [Spirometra erinaceieuropaei]
MRDLFLTPHPLEERSQMVHDLRAAVLGDINRASVRSGCFLAGELFQGPDGFVERGREVEVEVLAGLRLRQSGDDGVEGGVGAVKEEDTAVGSEESSSAFGLQSLDRLDREK